MSKLTDAKVKLFGRNIPILTVIIILLGCVLCCGIRYIQIQLWPDLATNTEKTSELVSESTNTPKPTNTPRRTNTPRPTEAASSIELDVYASGGLGVNRKVWEQDHKPDKPDDTGSSTYDNLKYRVMFLDENVYYLDVNLSSSELSLENAQALASVYLPNDGKFVETYVPAHADYLIVDVYTSESLKERFKDDWVWDDSEPGTFIVIYGLFPDGSSATIAPGNNP